MQTIQLQQTNIMTKRLLQKKGAKALLNGNFQGAFYLFESAFWLDTHDLILQLGFILLIWVWILGKRQLAFMTFIKAYSQLKNAQVSIGFNA